VTYTSVWVFVAVPVDDTLCEAASVWVSVMVCVWVRRVSVATSVCGFVVVTASDTLRDAATVGVSAMVCVRVRRVLVAVAEATALEKETVRDGDSGTDNVPATPIIVIDAVYEGGTHGWITMSLPPEGPYTTVGVMGASTAAASDDGGASANAFVFVRAKWLVDTAVGVSALLLSHRINGRANVHWNRLLSATSTTAGKDEVPARSKPTQVPTQCSAVPPDTAKIAIGLEPSAAPSSGQPAPIGAAEAIPPTTSVTLAPLTEIATQQAGPPAVSS
jgi:hypothetical protein